ncbi:MAG: ATP-binding protein [Terracidiphilus sp.]|jgi:signal transduction histidine kinase
MQQAEALGGTARKRESAGRKHQGLELKANRTDGKQNGQNRKRVETVVETLATLHSRGETLAEVAHDARNMVTALGLYCDLLEEPGVLATPFLHYGHELRLVAAASRRLVEKIVTIDAQNSAQKAAQQDPQTGAQSPARAAALPLGLAPAAISAAYEETDQVGAQTRGRAPGPNSAANSNRRWDLLPAVPVSNLAAELLANRNLLAALAGPSIALTVHAEGGARPVRLTGEDLTRVMVNLVKNSTEAMPSGGRIHIGLREQPAAQGAADCLFVTVEDNGPGIPADAQETIFASGYTSHGMSEGQSEGSYGNWTLSHRGLGLTISRSIVEGAGGRITACNREQGGARFSIELPLRKTS